MVRCGADGGGIGGLVAGGLRLPALAWLPGQSQVQVASPLLVTVQPAPPLYAGTPSTAPAITPVGAQPAAQPVAFVSTSIVTACGGIGGGGDGGGGEGGGIETPFTKVMPPCMPPPVLDPTQCFVRGHEPPPTR